MPRWRFAGACLAVAATIAGGGIENARACSTCGCSLSSDWGLQGYSELPGWQYDFRFESFEQSQLRSGTHGVDRSTIAFPNEDEIQVSTLNRNLWLGLNYVSRSPWSVSLQVPFHDRDHSTIVDGDTEISTSRASGLGDVRVMGRYTLTQAMDRSWSVQFGAKLPTGRFDQNFASGPQAGERLDRGLQLGTGTTDLLAGISYFTRPSVSLGVFGQALLDQPLNARDSFRPSTSLTLTGGLRWLNSSRFTPQLQINTKWEGRESGENSDRDNSGGFIANLSPGVTAEIGDHSHAFAFVQIPVYQRVNGLQLEPHWLLSVGYSFRR